MSEHAGSSAARRKETSLALAETYASLSDDEVVQQVLANHKPSANPVVRIVWIVFGSIFVVFAAVGVFLPGWPTTSWLVAAAYCYGRSSQNLFRWLVTNRVFGSLLLNYYRSGRAFPLHSKIAYLWIDWYCLCRFHLVHHHPWRPGVRSNHHRHHCCHRYLVGRMARPQHGLKQR